MHAERETGRPGRRRPKGYAEWAPRAATRDLLDAVDDVLGAYAEHVPLTIRQVFYALVAGEKIDKTENAYERLCNHLARARRARWIEFGAIRDDNVTMTRMRAYNGVEDFVDETARRAREYQRDRQEGQPQYIEVWCEAAGMVPQLARVGYPFSVPVYSAGGFVSLKAVRMIVDRAVDRDRPTVLLHVGDFDPSGESIFDSLATDAAASCAWIARSQYSAWRPNAWH